MDITVNNKISILKYQLDSLDSLKKRIAKALKISYKLIYIDPSINIYDIKDNINVTNIYNEIKQYVKNNKHIIELPYLNEIDAKYIIQIWMKVLDVSIIKLFTETELEQYSKPLIDNGYYKSHINFLSDWKKRSSFKIDSLSFSNIDDNTLQIYDNVNNPIIYSHIKQTFIDEDTIIQNNHFEFIKHIFNEINVNDYIPFIQIDNFYKIVKNFRIPNNEWITTPKKECMIIWVKYLEKFHKVGIELNQELNVIINIKTTLEEKDRNTVIDIIKKLLYKNKSLIVTKRINNAKAYFYYNISNTFNFNTYIFADMVLNDPLFEYILYISDFNQATKKKPGTYIHFSHPIVNGTVKATLTEQLLNNKNEPLLSDFKDSQTYKKYLRVKISIIDDFKSINKFQIILGKLLQIYKNQYDSYLNIYKTYIQGFESKFFKQYEKITYEKPKGLYIHKDIFLENYSRIGCALPKNPSILDVSHDMKQYQEGTYLKFPKDDDPNLSNNQSYYICDKNKEYPYAGLVKNKLQNKDKYPYLPCCFKKNQRNKPKMKAYYDNIIIQKDETNIQGKIVTDKLLTNKQYGILPNNITNMLFFINSDINTFYYREGIENSPNEFNKNSFIGCVIKGLNKDTNKNYNDIRNELSKFAYLCKQELFNFDIVDIKKMIQNPELYFNPKYFIHLLEEYYNCDIIVFNNENNGNIMIPNYIHKYCKNLYYDEHKSKRPLLFIYEHSIDNFPTQCELIFNSKEEPTNKIYNHNKLYNDIYSMFFNMNYKFSKELRLIKFIDFPLKMTNIINQYIDAYGKTRILNIKIKNSIFSLILSGIQPLNKPLANEKLHKLKNTSIIGELVKRFNVNQQIINNNKTIQLNGTIGNVSVSIPVEIKGTLLNIKKIYNSIPFIEPKSSKLDKYMNYKRIANFIIDNALWSFSKYIAEKKVDNIDGNIIQSFIDDKTVILKTDDLSFIKPTFMFTFDSNLFDKQKRLQINDIVKRKLSQILYIKSYSDINYVKKLCQKNIVTSYFQSLNDFKKNDNEIIGVGTPSLNPIHRLRVNHDIRVDRNDAYFIQNDNIGNKNIYIAQNTFDLKYAIHILNYWLIYNINIASSIHSNILDNSIEYNLYTYNNSIDDMDKDNKTDQNHIIIKYKNIYIALLPFFK